MAELKRIVGKTYIGLLVCLLVFNMLILVSDKTDDLQVTYAYIEMLNTAEGVKSDSKLSTESATRAGLKDDDFLYNIKSYFIDLYYFF